MYLNSHSYVQIFDRLPAMAACQIINYRADAHEKWSLLTGISQASDGSGGLGFRFRVKV